MTYQKSGSIISIPEQYLPSLKILWKSVYAFGRNRVRNIKIMILTFLDIKSNRQARHGARGPISWYRSKELDKLNNFCSISLYKIFTRKKLLVSKNFDNLWILQASHEARGPFSWYCSIELDKVNNFCYICLYKFFKIKKLWYKTFLKIRRHGGSIFESRWASLSFDLDQWNSHHKRRYDQSTIAEIFSSISLMVFKNACGQRYQKIDQISNRKWRIKNPARQFLFHTNAYHPWKIHENPSTRLGEIE